MLNHFITFDSNAHMLTHTAIGAHKKAVIFGLDDVLFPKQDYLLQVYYLFANFLEYTAAVPPANELTQFLKTAYLTHGEAGLFERAAETFGIDQQYKANFQRLHLTAQLPLKLLLFPPVRQLMETLHQQNKQLLVLTDGNPVMQLNKLKHVEWNGVERTMKVYFSEELRAKRADPLDYLLLDNELDVSNVVYIHADAERGLMGVDRVHVAEFL